MNNVNTILAIDTSTATMAGAIMQGDQLLASVQTEAERNHSIHIMTNIEALLANSELKLQELDRMVTGIGPGSYTGVRIAVTAVKTLSWLSSVELVGISSLAGLAFSGVLEEEQTLEQALILPIVDARRGQVYTAAFRYEQQSDRAKRLTKDHIIIMKTWCEQWTAQLAQLKLEGITSIFIVGDVALHQESIAYLTEAAKATGIKVIAEAYRMNGRALAELGRGRWLTEWVITGTPHELVPNYAQLTEAEVKQNAKEQKEGRG